MRMCKHVDDNELTFFSHKKNEIINTISDDSSQNEEYFIQDNSITYDFVNKRICNESKSEYCKTIKYQLSLFAWFYTYDNQFVYYDGYYVQPFITDYIKNSENNTSSSFEYYTPDGEFCTVYKYIYSIKNKPDLTLYKVVPYSHDWVANPSCDDYFF